ncbi:MAG: site-2 protease family protein [Lentisphaeria bacterium]|nr:site-2 protease family protein [Lentisphaeria bacterium]
MGLFISKLWTSPQEFFLISLVVIFSICLHEYFHAQCALWMGDSMAADRGHLTLNPLKQMGFISILMFLFVGIAWGAVPVDPNRLRSRMKYGPLIVSLSGPFANFLLACAGYIAFTLLLIATGGEKPGFVMNNLLTLLLLLGVYNIVLMLFNLIPVPGLDGWNVLQCLFPKLRSGSSEFIKGSMIFLIFAAMMGIRFLFDFAVFVMMSGVSVAETFL